MRFRRVILTTIFAAFAGAMLFGGVAAQNKTYIWVRANETGQYPGYKRVIGGRLDKNGEDMAVCRGPINGFLVLGKLYGNSCLMAWSNKEVAASQNVDVFMTNRSWSWRQVHGLSKTQIEQGAVSPGGGQRSTGPEYICRWRFPNGVHNGKYVLKNGTCYVSYGGRQFDATDNFEIMFP